MLIFAITALLLVNLWTMRVFYVDKKCAIAGRRRISEANLLTLAFLGGTPGAFAARHLFRHKTRKQPFWTWLMLIAAIQLGVALGFSL